MADFEYFDILAKFETLSEEKVYCNFRFKMAVLVKRPKQIGSFKVHPKVESGEKKRGGRRSQVKNKDENLSLPQAIIWPKMGGTRRFPNNAEIIVKLNLTQQT